METQLYNIIDENGNYFCYNDFNGIASFLPVNAETKEIPSIAYAMPKEMAEKKVNYLINHTDNLITHPEKSCWRNNFKELKMIPFQSQQ